MENKTPETIWSHDTKFTHKTNLAFQTSKRCGLSYLHR